MVTVFRAGFHPAWPTAWPGFVGVPIGAVSEPFWSRATCRSGRAHPAESVSAIRRRHEDARPSRSRARRCRRLRGRNGPADWPGESGRQANPKAGAEAARRGRRRAGGAGHMPAACTSGARVEMASMRIWSRQLEAGHRSESDVTRGQHVGSVGAGRFPAPAARRGQVGRAPHRGVPSSTAGVRRRRPDSHSLSAVYETRGLSRRSIHGDRR